jgi:preprotein translocase subunit SecA
LKSPPIKPVIREDANDIIFASMQAKYHALADEIKERHLKGQPILVGTISIESSELLSQLLKKRGIKHDVLNAKQHEREADIIEKAGHQGAVTIATNMAGRGTDIKLGPGVVERGGLAVLGTERHESRRIDNQLRGRSGRQGDPGYSKFFLSAEDDLLRRFGGDRFKNQLSMLTKVKGSDAEQPVDFKMFSSFVQRAQNQIEGNNFDRRKTVLQYDEVLRKQREIIYQQRTDILKLDSILPVVEGMMERTLMGMVENHINEEGFDHQGFIDQAKTILEADQLEDIKSIKEADALKIALNKLIQDDITFKRGKVGEESFNEFLKVVLLRVVDTYWMRHIDQMSELRQSIGLRGYGQVNPLNEYQEIGFQLFNDLVANIEHDATQYVLRAKIRDNLERVQVAKPVKESSGKDEPTKKAPVKVSKVGRNDPCPCGSGKKYKHCHGA